MPTLKHTARSVLQRVTRESTSWGSAVHKVKKLECSDRHFFCSSLALSMFFPVCLTLVCFVGLVKAQSRTSPPAGAVIVRAGTTTKGEFANVGSAINSLPDDTSSQTVFIFPGTYQGQVNITRSGPVKVSIFPLLVVLRAGADLFWTMATFVDTWIYH